MRTRKQNENKITTFEKSPEETTYETNVEIWWKWIQSNKRKEEKNDYLMMLFQ